jgi:hypothetical protein
MAHDGYYSESSNLGNINDLLDEAELYRDQAAASATAADASADAAALSATAADASADAAAANAALTSVDVTSSSSNATSANNSAISAAASKDAAAATLANALIKTNNLSDLSNVGTARVNLGVVKQTSQTDTTAGRLVIQGGQSLITADTVAIGFSTGAGGTVVQATSKDTQITLHKPTGRITTNSEALAPGASVTFSFINSSIALADVLLLNPSNNGNYNVDCRTVVAGGASIRITNITAGSLSEAFSINFLVIKGATA